MSNVLIRYIPMQYNNCLFVAYCFRHCIIIKVSMRPKSTSRKWNFISNSVWKTRFAGSSFIDRSLRSVRGLRVGGVRKMAVRDCRAACARAPSLRRCRTFRNGTKRPSESVFSPSSSAFAAAAAAEPGRITYTCVVITSSTPPTKCEYVVYGLYRKKKKLKKRWNKFGYKL